MCLGDKIHDASECLDLDRCRCVWGRQGERVCGVQPGGCAWVTRSQSRIQDPLPGPGPLQVGRGGRGWEQD